MVASSPNNEQYRDEDGAADKALGLFTASPIQSADVAQPLVAFMLEPPADEPAAPPPPPGPGGSEEGGPAARSWFPEAFLWAPEVLTTSSGQATLELRVPDSLTTWRLLALAHDDRGLQAGTLHTFDSSLPLYVDPVVPAWLQVGDHIELPLQATNNTPQPVSAELSIQATGAITGQATASVALAPGGSLVRSLPFDATRPGLASLAASLRSSAGEDAAVRSIPVLPAGKPLKTTRSGSLAKQRTFRLPPPRDADPTTDRLDVLVFPGPLSVLQLEMQRLADGARPQDPAYAAALAHGVETLAQQSKVEADHELLRSLSLASRQRILAASRAPSPADAADLLLTMRAVPDAPLEGGREDLLTSARKGWVRALEQAQRADGTWARQDRSPLQQLLAQTALAASVLPKDAKGPRLRAQAALERYQHEIEDAYTSAVVLSSGLAGPELSESLLERLLASVSVDSESGEVSLASPEEVLGPWGAPSRAEMLAWTVFALQGAPENSKGVVSADFAALLLQGWSPERGFGAGRADALCLSAVIEALGGAPAALEVSLLLEGQPVASATLDPSQPFVPARLSAETQGQDVSVTLSSSFGVPGLSFLATRTSYVPWSEQDRLSGVEVEVESGPLRVGVEGELKVTLSAPSGASVRLELPLPSGTAAGEEAQGLALEAGASLVERSDRLEVWTRAFEPGEVMEIRIPVVPSFAGRFGTAPMLVSTGGTAPVALRPIPWQVAR